MRRLFCVVMWACVTVAALSLFYYHAYTAWPAADSEQILLAASLSSRQNHCNNIVVDAVDSRSLKKPKKRPTFHNQPCRCFLALHTEHEGAGVLNRQVWDGEAVNFSLSAHAEVIRLFKLDSISHPHADNLGMGELYLKSCRFSLCGFNICQASLDCNFPSCEDFFGREKQPY